MELTIENLIKIIIGVLVFVIVVFGIYVFFRDYVFEFFRGGNQIANAVLNLLK